MPKEVLIISKDEKRESWGSLTQICKQHPEFQYHTIKKLKFPFVHKEWTFEKLEYNKLNKD